MMDSLRMWWTGHSAVERGVMAALGMAIVVVCIWLGVWRPVTSAITDGWARQGAALDRLAAVRTRVDTLKALPNAAAGGSARPPIDQLVGQTAAEAGFTLDRSAGQGAGRVAISIGSARMGPLLAWLSRLEESGVLVQTIGITPTATAGTVAVQAVLAENRP